MKILKERKSLLVKILAVVLLVLMCCNLPSLLFWPLCLKQDLLRPPNTEVLVSACKRPVATGVPGGEVVFVREGRTNKMYLLDLHTGKKRDVPNDPLLLDHGIFLNSELVWLEGSSSRLESPGYRPHYILDLADGKRYELLDLTWLPLNDRNFDPKYYVYFQSAEQVFIHHTKNELIALSFDFRRHPEGNVIFSQFSLGSGPGTENGELLERLMKDLGVNYEVVDFSLKFADVFSPTGRYVVRNNGIYLSETNVPVITDYMEYYFKSWYYDESGIVVRDVTTFLVSAPLIGSHYVIPAPILKLQLPVP